MATLSLEECKKALKNPHVSSKDFSKILDSFKYHLQNGKKEEVDKAVQLIEGITEPITYLFERVETLEKELEETKKELEEVKEKWESLKTLEDSLLIGELASTLEKEIVEKFLQGTGVSPKHHTIQQIFIALQNEDDYMLPLTLKQKDIIKANKNDLERKYKLDKALYSIITALKYSRNIKAHPSIENISTHLSDMVDQSDKEDAEEMLRVLRKIQKKM